MVRNGNDFPTAWNTVLKRNAFVDGFPHSQMEGTEAVLVIHLVTGERLMFHGDAKRFDVK